MKLRKMKLHWFLPLLIFGAFIYGCQNELTESLYNPNKSVGAVPEIISILPADSTLAGVGLITINGNNFSPIPSHNMIFFGDKLAEIKTASEKQLVVKSPNIVGDSIAIKIAVDGVAAFSNVVKYKLKSSVSKLTEFKEGEEPWSITCDAEGNVYVSMLSFGQGVGVRKILSNGNILDYAPRSSEKYWFSMKVGPDGGIYTTRKIRAIFKIPPGGGKASTWVALKNRREKVIDLDFDHEGNIWAGGEGGNALFRVTPDKNIKEFPFIAEVHSVRVFENSLFLAGERDSVSTIWRLPILSPDSLGSEEFYFNFSAAFPGYSALAITFARDGDLYIGTDAPESIVVVHPDKSYEPLYPGLFQSTSLYFAWGTGTNLFVTRQGNENVSQTILKVEMLKESAPYFGRGDQ